MDNLPRAADAQVVNLGLDAQLANDIMVKSLVEGAGNGQATQVYLARAFGNTPQEAKENLAKLLDSPEQLERESVDWWNQYLNEVPHLDTPDESFSKNFLWSWANFRMNRIDLPRGKVPAGQFYSNNVELKVKPMICGGGDQGAGEAIQLLHDANPAHELLLFLLRETRKHGILSPGFWGDGHDPFTHKVLGYDEVDMSKVIGELGYHTERVTEPSEVVLALKRAFSANESGQPAYIEFICSQFPVYGGWVSK